MENEIFDSKHLPVVAHLCNQLNIEKIANKILPWDQRQWDLPPGVVIKAFVIDALHERSALYRMSEFYKTVDIESLLGPGVKAEQLNDDRLGRTLDLIFEYGPQKLFSTIALQAIDTFQIELDSLHADTTSKNVFGNYGFQDPNGIEITNGYSKDKRPDLKQFLFGVVATREKIPILGNLCDGNTADKSWNNQLLKTIKNQLPAVDLYQITLVADSALIFEDNLIVLNGVPIHIISRLPATFSLCQQLMERSVGDEGWENIGKLSTRTGSACYRLKSYQESLYGRKYRFVVVHSDNHHQRKLKALDKKIAAEHNHLLKLNKKPVWFHCEKDAQLVANQVKNATVFWNVSTQVQPFEVKKKTGKRGRRPQNVPIEYDTLYKVTYEITENQTKIDQEKQKAGMFVLITTHLERFSNKEILVEYKEQVSVEKCFPFLKSPMIVEQIFLKKNTRIEALGYLMLIALMVWNLMERQLRRNITTPLIGPGKISMAKPTAWAIMMMLNSIKVIVPKIYLIIKYCA